jgi:hypothetical protein
MGLDRVPSGKALPNDFNVVIEIPMHADPVKYEVDKESGQVFVDRFMSTAMHYPCNYGYIPHTIAGDDDPLMSWSSPSSRCRLVWSFAAGRSACWPWKTRPDRMASCWRFRWTA